MVKKGIAAHGVPQRLLSDNGAALNPSRRGVLGQLVAYVTALGVEPITGKPYKPTTQGKNERFHQTLFRYLDKQPLAGHARAAAGAGRRVRPASITPNGRTRRCPAGSPRSRPGTRRRKPTRRDRCPRTAATPSQTPPRSRPRTAAPPRHPGRDDPPERHRQGSRDPVPRQPHPPRTRRLPHRRTRQPS